MISGRPATVDGMETDMEGFEKNVIAIAGLCTDASKTRDAANEVRKKGKSPISSFTLLLEYSYE
ncbi:MAG: hypothetical protein M0Q92_05070 [Methanoregula sp.]|jgi:hypothetical protein|nr:hypothetical protein [Methanoregula sp.]